MSRRLDLDGCWRLDPRVGLRPEEFGALAYHFGTRRLSFIKSTVVVEVLDALDGVSSLREACERAGVAGGQRPSVERALATLAETEMLVPVEVP
jgi:putative mycofactocin binding protein MftB